MTHSTGDTPPDRAVEDHTYVINRIRLPTTLNQGNVFGVDVDGNGDSDNLLALLFADLKLNLPFLDLQTPLDTQFDRGELVLLADVRATDFVGPGATELGLFFGTTNVAPPACNGDTDPICRKHFDGTGSFIVDAETPVDNVLSGTVSAGTASFDRAGIGIKLSVLGGPPFPLWLHSAKAELRGVYDGGWGAVGSKIGGAISQHDLDTIVSPAFADAFRAIVDETCTSGSSPCECDPGSDGEELIQILNAGTPFPNSCTFENYQVKSFLEGFVQPDIDLTGDGTPDAYSFGVGISAIAGSFTVP